MVDGPARRIGKIVSATRREGISPGLDAVFLRVAPTDIAFVKFIIESYEEVGLVRTLDRRAAVIVFLIGVDFREVAESVLRSLENAVPLERVAPPDGAGEDWLLRLLWDEGD
jgi:hypothetical protein